jgi:hypothetical membrane protein
MQWLQPSLNKSNHALFTMKYSYAKAAGTLVFIGAVQFLLGLIIAEALYPGYSISENHISDLGVGPSAAIFNSSVFSLGVMIVIGAYFFWREFDSKLFFIFLVLAGFGAMGVGFFTEDAGTIHAVVSLITFLFGGLSPSHVQAAKIATFLLRGSIRYYDTRGTHPFHFRHLSRFREGRHGAHGCIPRSAVGSGFQWLSNWLI